MRLASDDRYKRIRAFQGEQRVLCIQAKEREAYLHLQPRPTVRCFYVQRSLHELALQSKPTQFLHHGFKDRRGKISYGDPESSQAQRRRYEMHIDLALRAQAAPEDSSLRSTPSDKPDDTSLDAPQRIFFAEHSPCVLHAFRQPVPSVLVWQHMLQPDTPGLCQLWKWGCSYSSEERRGREELPHDSRNHHSHCSRHTDYLFEEASWPFRHGPIEGNNSPQHGSSGVSKRQQCHTYAQEGIPGGHPDQEPNWYCHVRYIHCSWPKRRAKDLHIKDVHAFARGASTSDFNSNAEKGAASAKKPSCPAIIPNSVRRLLV